MTNSETLHLKQIWGKFMHDAWAVGGTMSHAIGDLASQQIKGTEQSNNRGHFALSQPCGHTFNPDAEGLQGSGVTLTIDRLSGATCLAVRGKTETMGVASSAQNSCFDNA